MTKKMKENKAGLYVPNRFAEEISDALRSSGMPADFVRGGEVVLGYLNCPEDADMHGTGIEVADCRVVRLGGDAA